MQTHTLRQNRMLHYVKTAAGVSKSYIKWDNIDEDMEIMKKNIEETMVVTGNIGGIG